MQIKGCTIWAKRNGQTFFQYLFSTLLKILFKFRKELFSRFNNDTYKKNRAFAEVDETFKTCFVSGNGRNCPLRKKCEILEEKLQKGKKKHEASLRLHTHLQTFQVEFLYSPNNGEWKKILTDCCVENIIKNLGGGYLSPGCLAKERWEKIVFLKKREENMFLEHTGQCGRHRKLKSTSLGLWKSYLPFIIPKGTFWYFINPIPTLLEKNSMQAAILLICILVYILFLIVAEKGLLC